MVTSTLTAILVPKCLSSFTTVLTSVALSSSILQVKIVNNAKNLKERSTSPNGKKKGRLHKDKKFPKRLRSMFISPSHHRVNSASSSFGEFTVSDDTAPKMSEVNLLILFHPMSEV